MTYALHPYQQRGVDLIHTMPGVGLLWDMGVGKTLTVLHALASHPFGSRRVLIVAPKRCCTRVWPSEIEKFGFYLPCAVITGPLKNREKAASSDRSVHIINPENVKWLYERCKKAKRVPYDVLVVDESTDFKSHGSARFKALKEIAKHIPERVILTGTPIPKNYVDLWAQVYLLDFGKALGKNITEFRRRYCEQDFFKQWHVRKNCYEEIDNAIAHLVDRCDAKDHLAMPELIYNRVVIDLPSDVKRAYDLGVWELQQELPEDGFDSTAKSFTRLRTLCSGFAYVEDDSAPGGRETKWLHEEKLDAIEEIRNGIGGKSLLVAFNFTAEREALQRRFKCEAIDGKTSDKKADRLVDAWCRGELPMLAVQPGTVRYGLNMQSGGHHLAWFSLPTSLTDWQQTNARLYRQGQVNGVTVHSVLASGTVDERLIGLLESKESTQEGFLQRMKESVYVSGGLR